MVACLIRASGEVDFVPPPSAAREVSFAAMRDEIEVRFKADLDRVRAIVVAYQDRARPGSGRQAVHTVDLFRAAGYHGAASLGQELVSRWIVSVEGLCTDILAAL